MAVSLGRSITNPFFVLAQIINAVSLFFLFLGLFRVLLAMGALHAMWVTVAQEKTPSSAPQRVAGNSLAAAEEGHTVASFTGALGACFHVSLASLFGGPVKVRVVGAGLLDASNTVVDSSKTEFFWMHLLTALALSYPLAVSLQRRKFVLDFVLTIYGVYGVLTSIIRAQFFGGAQLHWWVTVALCAGVLYGAAWWICRRRELADVSLGSGPTSAATGTAAVVATGAPAAVQRRYVEVDESEGDEAHEMLAVQRGSGGTPAASPVPAGASVAVPSLHRTLSPRPQLTSPAPAPGPGSAAETTEPPTVAFRLPPPGTASKRKNR